jgi:hypothetical protein
MFYTIQKKTLKSSFLRCNENHLLPVHSLDKEDGVPRSQDRPRNKLDRPQCSRLVPVWVRSGPMFSDRTADRGTKKKSVVCYICGPGRSAIQWKGMECWSRPKHAAAQRYFIFHSRKDRRYKKFVASSSYQTQWPHLYSECPSYQIFSSFLSGNVQIIYTPGSSLSSPRRSKCISTLRNRYCWNTGLPSTPLLGMCVRRVAKIDY